MGIYLPVLGDGLPVLIQELFPPFRLMTFAGKDRPEPVDRETTQRDKQSWYPGASQASTQVFGTKEEPVNLVGWFRDPLSLLDGGPQARISLIRGIQAGQRLCILMWGDAISVRGRIRKAKFTYHMLNKVQYDIEFAVDSVAAEFKAPAPIPIGASTAADLALDVQTVGAIFGDVVRVASLLPV